MVVTTDVKSATECIYTRTLCDCVSWLVMPLYNPLKMMELPLAPIGATPYAPAGAAYCALAQAHQVLQPVQAAGPGTW